ncbi:hypothetical protein [Nocardia nova]|uniref:hypothetical protein n=1 Tax=Nocardia nova TaxID=37330 RepID=UPI0033CDD4B3
MTAVDSHIAGAAEHSSSARSRPAGVRATVLAVLGVVVLVCLAGRSQGAPPQLPIALTLVPVAAVLTVMTARTPRRIALYGCAGAAIAAAVTAAYAQLVTGRHGRNYQIPLDPLLAWAPIATVVSTIAIAFAVYVADCRHTLDSPDQAVRPPR